jgi:hypothetical protein
MSTNIDRRGMAMRPTPNPKVDAIRAAINRTDITAAI